MEPDRQLVIPVAGPQLGQFISDLLGQRRRIEKVFLLPNLFASYDQILNVMEVIFQRLNQNRHSLVAFSCTYYFKNGRRIAVYDIQDFRNFNDLSSDETVGLDINLTYLAEFPTATIPEKQEIRIEAFSDVRIRYALHELDEKLPLLKYTIAASHLTWGEDLAHHIDPQLASMIVNDFFREFTVRSSVSDSDFSLMG
jgi:hypothetical protein